MHRMALYAMHACARALLRTHVRRMHAQRARGGSTNWRAAAHNSSIDGAAGALRRAQPLGARLLLARSRPPRCQLRI
jgi:hypothetical protein